MNRAKGIAEKRRLRGLACAVLLLAVLGTGGQAKAQSDSRESTDFQRAIQFFEAGSYPESARILLKLAKVHPENGVYWLNLGNAFYSLERYPDAIRAYGHVVSLTQSGKSTLGPMALLYIGKSYRKSGDRERALSTLKALQSAQPPAHIASAAEEELSLLGEPSPSEGEDDDDEIRELARQGLASYHDERFEEALATFNDVMELEPSANAAMMVGMSHLRLNEPQEAAYAFNEVLKLNPNPSLRASALEFINQIQRNLWSKKSRWWLWFDLAYGSDSNVFENGASETQIASPETQAMASIGYHFLQKKPWLFDLGYQYTLLDFANASSARLQTHSVQAPLSHQTRTWLLQIAPYAQSQTLGSSALETRFGSSATLHRYLGSYGLGVISDFSSASGAAGTYDYLTGSTTSAKAYVEYTTGRLYLSLYYLYLNEQIGDMPYGSGTLPLAENSNGAGLCASWLWRPNLQLQGSVSESLKDYTNIDKVDGIYRKDAQTYAIARINYFISPALTIYFSQDATFNQSTLGKGDIADKNFTKFISFLGVTWNVVQ